jgi:hypothetical protein
MKTLLLCAALVSGPLALVGGVEHLYQRSKAVDRLQLDPQDAALRALAYEMQRCGWKRENINATLKFYLPGGDEAMRKFWQRVDTDTHRSWFNCPEKM